MKEEIIELILATAKDLGEDEIGLTDALNAESVLYGEDGVLDSMGLVTLIVAVEQEIEDRIADLEAADVLAADGGRGPCFVPRPRWLRPWAFVQTRHPIQPAYRRVTRAVSSPG